MDPKRAVAFDRRFGRRFYRFHRRVYTLTGGLVGHHTGQGPMLLLTTTGRKSGEPRTTPLLYMPDGGSYLVVGSNGGRPEPSAWVLNLQACPDARIQVGRRKTAARAQILGDEEAAALWPRLDAHYKGWAYYQTLTERELPVVRLTPVG
jgi:deazaflavin-dependent oxidoreductase (nitroreductase family)